MEKYNIVKPENFTISHITYINSFKNAIDFISSQTDLILGAKDINSKHIIATDSYAKIVGLKYGTDVIDRYDKDMPCEGTAQYADLYVQEDLSLINNINHSIGISILNVHNYSDGIKARVFKKYLLKHEKSKSILGTIYSGYDVELKDFLNILPSYIIQFGAIGCIQSINENNLINNTYKLSNYEQEICFLLLLNWNFKQIASFMNEFRPDNTERTSDTIIKKKNYICEKLNINSNLVGELREFLLNIGFHNKMPVSFYNRIIGSKILGEIPVII